jgi:hypothetical protein
MVKWTTSNPYLVFRDNDSKLYINFEFHEEKILDILKNTNLQSQSNYNDKKSSKKNLHTLEDSTSDMQVGDIEQVIV